jgi:hypothetical protein
MAINKTLLRRVRNHILAEPRRYAQETFGRYEPQSPCNTAACLFGWADYLANETSLEDVQEYYHSPTLVAKRATAALGLKPSQAKVVMSSSGEKWPEPYRSKFLHARTDEAEARVAADYINYILRTGKVD